MKLNMAFPPIYSPQNSFTYPLINKVIKNGGETNTKLATLMQDN